MLVGFDTEYGFEQVQERRDGRLHGDQSTMQPVCACLYFEDHREVRLTVHIDRLQNYFDDPGYTFVVHDRQRKVVSAQWPRTAPTQMIRGFRESK